MRQVLEAVPSQISNALVAREVIGHELIRGSRHHDLTAVGGRRDPRGPMNVHPDIRQVAHRRLTAVQPHPHLNVRPIRPGRGRKPMLTLDTSLHREGGTPERRQRNCHPPCRARNRRTVRTRLARPPAADRARRHSHRRACGSSSVEPSMSVNSRVTVPAGSSTIPEACASTRQGATRTAAAGRGHHPQSGLVRRVKRRDDPYAAEPPDLGTGLTSQRATRSAGGCERPVKNTANTSITPTRNTAMPTSDSTTSRTNWTGWTEGPAQIV